jgi:AcrR family transcriptional regulator
MGASARPASLGTERAQNTVAFRDAAQPDASASRTRATPAGAFLAARRMFLKGQRLDMRSLSAELEISRATLYRWCGDRERLMGDVIWSLSHDLFEQALKDHPSHTGAARVLGIFRQHTSAIVRAEPLRKFLQQETHAALRLLTSRGGAVQSRTVSDLADLLRGEQRAGALKLRADADSLAYAIVRITEGFIYHDTVVGAEPDVERAAEIVALLLC